MGPLRVCCRAALLRQHRLEYASAMAGVQSIEQLQAMLRAQGVRTAYVKALAPKQDNEKNQVVLGGGLEGAANLFPARILPRSASESVSKRNSSAGQPKLEAQIDLDWLDADGRRWPAPGARIIDYFQYPEIRLSGFLGRCAAPPDALRRDRQAVYGQRWLILGTAGDGRVVGVVLTERDDPLARAMPDLPHLSRRSILRVLTVDAAAGSDPAQLLHEEMTAIVRAGWHWSRINRGGVIQPFSGAQGGGYTLEALLGVAANGDKAPDRHGFEIKSFSGSRISLMTPTPDLGFQGERPFREFMDRYGHPAQKGDGSLRFTGLYRAGAPNSSTGYVLSVRGYDRRSDTFEDASHVAVELTDPSDGRLIAGWSLEKLANCWNAKHASALYIPFDSRPGAAGAEYCYEPRWLIGRGTDVWRLLRAIDAGVVFYDPAHTLYADGRAKVRPQWRINASSLAVAMSRLYADSSVVTV